MLAIAMTLIAGAAAWSFARSQAGNSEGALQNGAIANNNMLAEHSTIADMYFGSSTTVTFILYNVGTITDQAASVRLYDSQATVNLFFNYTKHSPCSGDCVLDLSSSLAGKCKTAGGSYETPSLTQTTVRSSNEQFFTLTIPGTTTNCPSYGQTFSATDTYTLSLTGVYGNVISSSSLG